MGWMDAAWWAFDPFFTQIYLYIHAPTTGDIEAMWLRDSAFQLMPYLNFTKEDAALAALICNLARRQAYSIVHVTPYANAFNYNACACVYALFVWGASII